MHDKIKSMYSNGVWELVEILNGFKPVAINGVLRLKRILKVTLSGLRQDW